MGRYYRLSKKISLEEEEEILDEIKCIEDVKEVEFVNETYCIKVATKDNQFLDVMSKTVNICSRVANGLELTFAGFAN